MCWQLTLCGKKYQRPKKKKKWRFKFYSAMKDWGSLGSSTSGQKLNFTFKRNVFYHPIIAGFSGSLSLEKVCRTTLSDHNTMFTHHAKPYIVLTMFYWTIFIISVGLFHNGY